MHHSSPVKNSPLPPFKPLKPTSGFAATLSKPSRHRRSASGASASGVSDYLVKGSGGRGSRVDVNSATVFQLMTVPGLSQTLAQKIFVHRNRFGPFSTAHDLLRVKGVKAGWLETAEPYLMISRDSGGGTSWASLVSDVEPVRGSHFW